ncbi:hypothetical protein CAEBREN_09372 [Caenorhabditis brenneri]|uniref:F-box domain-containing protein n=1 Tax=Caenorhabditis brenneri TaxID=135651 RepID=G0PIN0_CAEBE|nr:hypothetical protein CAEBREN_09372 [Caenorhabditis brenneri]
MPNLLEMPPEIMQEIVDFVGCPEIFTLRNVCHDLRNFVDNIKPNFRLQKLGWTISSETMTIDCEQNDKKYSIKYDKSDQDQFFKMMEPILKFQKSTLTIFGTTDQSPIPGFYDKMKRILESRPSPLKVFELSMRCAYQYQIQSILSTLEPGTLERIWLDGRHFESLKFHKIVGLEQWKSANTLHVHTFTVHAPLTDFGNFKRVFALFGSVDWEDLDSLREIFLSNPETKRLFYIYHWGLNGWDEWRESLGPAINEDDGEPEWRFRYPNSDRTLRIAEFYDRIVFESLD